MSDFNIGDYAKSTVKEEIFSILNSTESNSSNKICVLFNADGVCFDAERLAHYASVHIYSEDNPNFKETLNELKDELSDLLIGVKDTHQFNKIKKFYRSKSLSVKPPYNFEGRRDAYKKILFQNLRPIFGFENLLDFLKSKDIDFALVTRSRLQPTLEKLLVTGLNKYFNGKNIFSVHDSLIESDIDRVSFIYSSKYGIDPTLLDVDKTSILIYAAAKLGYAPNQCIGVENTINGINSLIYSKMKPILFTGAESTPKQLTIESLAGGADNYTVCDRMF